MTRHHAGPEAVPYIDLLSDEAIALPPERDGRRIQLAAGALALQSPDASQRTEAPGDKAMYERVTPEIIREAKRRRPRDPDGFIDEYVANMITCRDQLIPALRDREGYTGTLPLSIISRSCIKSPHNFQSRIEGWFTGSLTAIRRLQESGDMIVGGDISQYLTAHHRAISSELDTADRLAENSPTAPRDTETLQRLRAAYREGTLSYKPGRMAAWPATVMRYAIHTYAKHEQDPIDETAITEAAAYATASLAAYNRQHAHVLPTGIASKTGVAFAYLDDVRTLQRSGFKGAYAVARYHDAPSLVRLAQEYERQHISRGMINTIYTKTPLTPRTSLEKLVRERQAITDVLAGTPHSIDIETVTHLATRRPHGARDKVARFLSTYVPLLEANRDSPGFEDWMAARAAVVYADKPQNGVTFYTRLAREGLFMRSAAATTTKGRGHAPQEFDLLENVVTAAQSNPELLGRLQSLAEDAGVSQEELESLLDYLAATQT